MHCAACTILCMFIAATEMAGLAGAAAVSISLNNSVTGKVEAFTDFAGNLQLNSVYQPENDLTEQRAALEELYAALGGDYWAAAYKQLTEIEEVEAIANASSTSSESLLFSMLLLAECQVNHVLCVLLCAMVQHLPFLAGVTYVDFPLFADIFTFKVPWFTPGFSYCRWWGVTCCLTASESVLPICSFLQSVGSITLTGEPQNRQSGFVCCMRVDFVNATPFFWAGGVARGCRIAVHHTYMQHNKPYSSNGRPFTAETRWTSAPACLLYSHVRQSSGVGTC